MTEDRIVRTPQKVKEDQKDPVSDGPTPYKQADSLSGQKKNYRQEKVVEH
jgi:hypothetical protein